LADVGDSNSLRGAKDVLLLFINELMFFPTETRTPQRWRSVIWRPTGAPAGQVSPHRRPITNAIAGSARTQVFVS